METFAYQIFLAQNHGALNNILMLPAVADSTMRNAVSLPGGRLSRLAEFPRKDPAGDKVGFQLITHLLLANLFRSLTKILRLGYAECGNHRI